MFLFTLSTSRHMETHDAGNFKGCDQRDEWEMPVELHMVLYPLTPSEFVTVNVIIVIDHLYRSAKLQQLQPEIHLLKKS